MKNDTWIKEQVKTNEMIKPFVDHTVREVDGKKVLSYGLSPSGYDLRLQDEVFVESGHVISGMNIDPKNKKTINRDGLMVREDENGRYVIVPPKSPFWASTVERLKMPRSVSGFVLPKSSYARCGIEVINPLIDAGWEGNLTIACVNTSQHPMRVYLNEGFCQLCLFDIGECEVSYDERGGLYQNAKGVMFTEV